MSLQRHVPNVLTLGNLLCGSAGIVNALQYSTISAAWFVWAACIFDFLDGFAARTLKVHSPIGKELDSLADMVSFGVLPGIVMFQMMDILSPSTLLPYSAFLITAFSALRLAKFNVDENQKDSFVGLPTPANALLITALPALQEPWDMLISQDYFLLIITLVSSMLLVLPVELFALKFKNYRWGENKVRFTFIAVSVLLLILWQASALPFVILFYIGMSLLTRWVRI